MGDSSLRRWARVGGRVGGVRLRRWARAWLSSSHMTRPRTTADHCTDCTCAEMLAKVSAVRNKPLGKQAGPGARSPAPASPLTRRLCRGRP